MHTQTKLKLRPVLVVLASIILAGVMCFLSVTRHRDIINSANPPAASLDLPAPPDSSEKEHALKVLRFHRSAALDEALREPDCQKRGIAFGKALSLWLDEDFEGALSYVKGMPQGASYNEGLFMVLERLGKCDPERAVSLAREMATTCEQQQVYSALFAQIAGRDLAEALNFLALTPAGEGRDNALRSVASAWADKDMNSSLNWVQSLSDPDERNLALETLLLTLARQEPQRALTLAAESLNGGALERVVATGLNQMIQDDPQAAGILINRLPAGELQTQATVNVARALTGQQPETALAWLQSLPSDELRQTALNNVLDVWNAQSPANVALYVARMPAGDDQDASVNHLARGFGAANPTEAMQWAETLPADSARNVAVVNIVSGWAENDPAGATLWAQNLMPNNPARLKALRGAYSYWVLEDAGAAGRFAGTLSSDERAQLLDK